MPQQYTRIDRELVGQDGGVALRISPPSVSLPGGTGFPSGSATIDFQFPPKLSSDSKSKSWKEVHNPASWEEIVVNTGAKGREITLKWTYVNDGGQWTGDRISKLVRTIRSYFYVTIAEDALPIIQLALYDVIPRASGGIPEATFRGKTISVIYGDSLIKDSSGVTYPLKTEISLNLQLITRVAEQSEGGNGRSQYRFNNLPDAPPQEWY